MTPREEQSVLNSVYLRGDLILRRATGVHALIALALAWVHGTWLLALGVSALAAGGVWVATWLRPGAFITRVLGGVALQLFCALYLVQLDGQPEMYLFVFTSFTLMIFYKDPRALWPAAGVLVLTQLLLAPRFDQSLLTRVFPLSVALAQVVIASAVSSNLRNRTLHDFEKAAALETQLTHTRRLMDDLEKTRSRLVQTEKLATAGQLAAGVGHEINNPLAFVMGNLDHLQRRLSEESATLSKLHDYEDLRDALSEASEGARRIAAIVRDLKTFARNDDASLGPVDVKASLEFALSMAAPEIRHRAQVVRDYGEVPSVEANEAKLGQVFLVLLVNAAQALREGGIADNRITVTTRAEPHGRVRITVQDTGPGIAAENLARIFDPFFTTKPVGEGTGLGLSIASNIVDTLGGHIEVESRPHEGARFHVVLRASSEVARPRSTGKTPSTPIRAQPVVRVLVIDDEADMAPLITRVLGPEVHVTSVLSGRAALELLAHQTFDLILCDVMMPDVSGADVYRAIAAERPALLPNVVMMTGGAFTEESRAFVEALPHETLDKPFTATQLRGLLDVVKKRGAA